LAVAESTDSGERFAGNGLCGRGALVEAGGDGCVVVIDQKGSREPERFSFLFPFALSSLLLWLCLYHPCQIRECGGSVWIWSAPARPGMGTGPAVAGSASRKAATCRRIPKAWCRVGHV